MPRPGILARTIPGRRSAPARAASLISRTALKGVFCASRKTGATCAAQTLTLACSTIRPPEFSFRARRRHARRRLVSRLHRHGRQVVAQRHILGEVLFRDAPLDLVLSVLDAA